MTLKHKHSILQQVPDFDLFTCYAPAPYPIGWPELSREDCRQISRFSDFPEFSTTQKRESTLTSLTPIRWRAYAATSCAKSFPRQAYLA